MLRNAVDILLVIFLIVMIWYWWNMIQQQQDEKRLRNEMLRAMEDYFKKGNDE